MMNTNEIPTLQIGDKIGFVSLAADIDQNDVVNFFPVVEVTERDNETAYFYQYPDGEISRTAIKHSWLAGHPLQLQPRNAQMICLNNKDDFKSALNRGLNDNLQVHHNSDWDSFTVKNLTKQTSYQVKLETRDNKTSASCTCPDFKWRKHQCKHIAEVLVDSFFGVTEFFGVVLNA